MPPHPTSASSAVQPPASCVAQPPASSVVQPPASSVVQPPASSVVQPPASSSLQRRPASTTSNNRLRCPCQSRQRQLRQLWQLWQLWAEPRWSRDRHRPGHRPRHRRIARASGRGGGGGSLDAHSKAGGPAEKAGRGGKSPACGLRVVGASSPPTPSRRFLGHLPETCVTLRRRLTAIMFVGLVSHVGIIPGRVGLPPEVQTIFQQQLAAARAAPSLL